MKALVFSLILVAALAVMNPGPEKFEAYVETRAGEFFSREIGDNRIGEMLSDLGAGVTRSLARQVTRRDNYILFSLYTIDLDGSESHSDEWRFIGAVGRFFQIAEPEGVHDR